MKKRLMDIVSALVADRKSAVLRKPGQRALQNPPVPTQLLGAPYALSCYPALYPAPSQGSFALVVVVRFVGMQFLGTFPRSAPTPGPLMGSTASMSSSKTIESWTFAAVSATASGMPFR